VEKIVAKSFKDNSDDYAVKLGGSGVGLFLFSLSFFDTLSTFKPFIVRHRPQSGKIGKSVASRVYIITVSTAAAD
jgi:hypothetical protein